ncbi:hypothetical protein VI03_31065 [Burkholderia vietnamiensis]|uniref:hypothetical protein n=1 Tax=Burkholderia vietnamiensis TaxID=60552 RepID=UPI0006223489|nr:hypothetical protein [Burkholderia vietnamiensis]KKI34949.1 hypothetical protein VI03_31065 [Burkholderia vietnamiensis]TPQ42257.1 hypothetical protein C2U71_20350 [Burkholderia ubonensis]HDR9090084.1 hypothetical protein [Burkholderia vietnamiensis]
MARTRNSKQPRSKAELLPLPASPVRDISLKNHLTVATMRAGHGTAETMIALLRVLYLAYFVVESELSASDHALFLEVEAALQQCIEPAGSRQAWRVPDDALDALLRSDAIIGSVPKYRYLEAWEKLNRFAQSPNLSPIPRSKLQEVRA